ncbi:hypothetical protein K438DRAFT_1967218 [Mycena galopus ATCC 62051]|nr:hypothetical protein K438DRAFT_1967218 [Mycena galopus ATCC 62051]
MFWNCLQIIMYLLFTVLKAVFRMPSFTELYSNGMSLQYPGLFSDILLGFSMRSVLNVLQRDIVNVGNMHDPDSHLQAPEFLALLSVLVEDLSEETTNGYPFTKKAVGTIIEHPASIIIAGPTAIIFLFAEWVQGTYKQTKNSLRGLIGCIIDLTLLMDTLFYLVLSRGQTPMKITLINKALRIYKDRKSPVHTNIRAWADGWGTFSHLDESAAMKKIEKIHVHSVKPEQWDMQNELSDESWMAPDTLRET